MDIVYFSISPITFEYLNNLENNIYIYICLVYQHIEISLTAYLISLPRLTLRIARR